MKLLLFVLSLALSVSSVTAWWCNGHMLVAQIASDTVSDSTAAAIKPLIAYLAVDYPKTPEMMSAACWADDLKSEGVYLNENEHFVDLPVVLGPFFTGLPPISNNTGVIWAIKTLVKLLNDDRPLMLDQARALRFLIHFIGDLHQPLHAASAYSQQFPTGDEGGNKWKIQNANQTNLHSFFDSGAGLWQDDLERPLNGSGYDYLSNWSSTLEAAYPQSAFSKELADTDVADWAMDSNTLASTVAYTTPNGGPVSDDFVAKVRTLVQRQVTLGGYRLAQTLDSIFSSKHKKQHYASVHARN